MKLQTLSDFLRDVPKKETLKHNEIQKWFFPGEVTKPFRSIFDDTSDGYPLLEVAFRENWINTWEWNFCLVMRKKCLYTDRQFETIKKITKRILNYFKRDEVD